MEKRQKEKGNVPASADRARESSFQEVSDRKQSRMDRIGLPR